MSEAATEEVTWTYTNEDGRYDAALLTDSGKQAFNLLLEVNADVFCEISSPLSSLRRQ
jgi:hypothetical protein